MTHQPTLRSDYRPPDFRIDRIDLAFDLVPERTVVRAELQVRRTGDAAAPLVLDGEEMELLGVHVDGRALGADEYRLDPAHLTVATVPDAFTLVLEGAIRPAANTEDPAKPAVFHPGPASPTFTKAGSSVRPSFSLASKP